MPLREFQDGAGVWWRVWDVTPEAMHPLTAAQDYLGDYQEGWLSFESESERRRLARVPRNWGLLSEEELQWLLDAARVVGQRAGQAARAAEPPPPVARRRPEEGRLTPPTATEAYSGRRRIFTDPDGRVVIACVERLPAPLPDAGRKVPTSPGAVLRFKTDHRLVFDLAQWPDDWERLPKERLVELFVRAQRESEREALQREAERVARPAENRAQSPARRSTDEPRR